MGCTSSTQLRISKSVASEHPAISDQEDICSEESSQVFSSYCSFGQLISQNQDLNIMGYVFEEEIGMGSCSKVYRCVHQEDSIEYAAKVYSKNRLQKPKLGTDSILFDEVKSEIKIQSSLHHSHLVNLIEVLDDPQSDSFIVIMPLACGNLQNHHLSKDELRHCFYQIGLALEFMHSKRIAHRDIKPANLLYFSNNDYRICDFSSASEVGDTGLVNDTRGSPAYFAPEETTGDSFDPMIADVWSYGVSLYSLYFGSLPFNLLSIVGRPLPNALIAVTNILENSELEIPECDEQFEDLIRHILTKDPDKRSTMHEILQHPWFKSSG